MLEAKPGTVTFSGLAGGPSAGQRPGYNSVTRVPPKDRVRYFPSCVQLMLNNTPEANSLETLHGNIHVRTGGGGHMSNPISAGAYLLQFSHESVVDLVFPQASIRSLCFTIPTSVDCPRRLPVSDGCNQVDRQLALWQAIHPEVWISQQNESQFVNRGQSLCTCQCAPMVLMYEI